MPAGLVIMSAAGKLILANEQVEQIFRQPVPPGADFNQLAEILDFFTRRAALPPGGISPGPGPGARGDDHR